MFSLILLNNESHGQSDDSFQNVIRTEYTQLDEISRDFYSFLGGSRGQIEFILVEIVNLNTDEKILGVEVNIDRTDSEILAYSLGFSNIGSFWGSSSSVTARNLTNSGHILLLLDDLEIVIDFLNSVAAAVGIQQEKFKVYSVSIYDSFQLSMIYDSGWEFAFQVDSAHYKINFDDGLAMLRKLNEFKRYIETNS
ncbi:MAG: hypothetical protein R6U28_02750 [Cyclonatronaceae bacterium]